MRRQDEEQLHTPSVPGDESFTLESILAEYGKGGRQPAQMEEAPEPAPTPVPEPEPEPIPEPIPEPESEPEEITTRLPKTEKKKRKPRKKQDTVEFPVIHAEPEPAAPHAPPAPPEPEEELPPDRISLKNVMHDTVDAVLAENDDGILEPPPTLRERLQGLMSRRHVRRGLPQDTEQLGEEPQQRQKPEPPPEP